jgi:hypothetical protein
MQREEIAELRNHHGPFFLHWRDRMARSVGGHLDEERLATTAGLDHSPTT